MVNLLDENHIRQQQQQQNVKIFLNAQRHHSRNR